MTRDQAPAADLIVVARDISTVDDGVKEATAFAVRDGRFIYVGTRAGALAMRGVSTEVLDAARAFVFPGFIDAHMHLLAVGQKLLGVDLTHVANLTELVRRTVAFAATSDDEWIVGSGWDQNLWDEDVFPTHDALSQALAHRPVVLYRVDGHAILVNARAMELAGITAATPDPSGGRILRDESGAPSGVFLDNAQTLIFRAMPPPSDAQNLSAARAAIQECHRWGVTSVAEPGVDDAALQAYEGLAAHGELTVRNHTMLAGADNALLERRFARGPVTLAYDGQLSIRAVKLFADGALGSRGAALFDPYYDDPSNAGLLVTPQATIEDVCERALAAGFQLCTHAIGDRANRIVLDAYERALRHRPVADHRLRIEHAQVLAPADVPRFARLGVIASIQTSHQASDVAWVESRLGAARTRNAHAWRSLLSAGARIANGSDAPVEPVNPWRTFHAAVAREDEPMTRAEALRSMTIWAAYANFMERATGSIAVGKYADFTVLDRDLMTAEDDAILGTRVLATYASGRRVYEASDNVGRAGA